MNFRISIRSQAAIGSGLAIASLLFAHADVSNATSCAPYTWDAGRLSEAYASHRFVFVANVDAIVDAESAEVSLFYHLLEPSLKGDVPAEGSLELDSRLCSMPHLALKATMLIFLNELNESASVDNSVAIVYGDGKIVEEWVLEWVAGKLNDR